MPRIRDDAASRRGGRACMAPSLRRGSAMRAPLCTSGGTRRWVRRTLAFVRRPGSTWLKAGRRTLALFSSRGYSGSVLVGTVDLPEVDERLDDMLIAVVHLARELSRLARKGPKRPRAGIRLW
jgi:hypothetical protein